MDYNNGFSISFFFFSSFSFLWIGAQFPQEKFLSYGRILTLHYYFLLMCILFSPSLRFGSGFKRYLYLKKGNYKVEAKKFVTNLYAYEISNVLFKPTLGSKNQFRYDLNVILGSST